jgi:hypothetical protein
MSIIVGTKKRFHQYDKEFTGIVFASGEMIATSKVFVLSFVLTVEALHLDINMPPLAIG